MNEPAAAPIRVGFAVNTFYAGDPAELKEMLVLGPDAEQAGFDSVWIGDHVLWHTPIVDGLTLLSTFAAPTERVALGTGIYLLGLRKPYIAAKTLTSLNALAGGNRLILGFGVGGENPAEFELAEVPHKERGKALDNALKILLGQWDEDDEGPKLEPAGERPEILIGGRSNASRRRIINHNAKWLAAFVCARRVGEENELLAEKLERSPDSALHAYYHISDSDQASDQEGGDFLSHVYAMDRGPLMRYTLAGTPESFMEQLQAYRDVGVRHFCLRPASWDQRTQLERLAELLPQIKQLG